VNWRKVLKDQLRITSKLKILLPLFGFLTFHGITILDLFLLSMDTPQQKKYHKDGSVVRTEPSDMHLFYIEPMIREVFQRVGCLSLCQNMQRGHPEVAREFALNFDGTNTNVGTLEL
jgi:hypothetical protein